MAAQHPDSGKVPGPARGNTDDVRDHPLVVWCFTDGKPGHANQVQGLLEALRGLVPVNDYTLQMADVHAPLWSLLSGRFAPGRDLPDPDLIVGAGRATHLPMLAARRARGGRTVVLMKPGLPLSWFDLCIIPAHDRPRALPNVLQTTGVLNRVRFRADKDAAAGLFLIGGPSPHVDWSSEAMIEQISMIVEQSSAFRWQLATSRRTPDELVNLLHRLPTGELTVVPAASTGPDWLPQQLAAAAVVWVSSDSVSMVYEALTSGAAVGLLPVPYRKADDRLADGLRKLQDNGLVTDYEGWLHGRELLPPDEPLDEAGRCAKWIVDQWLASG